MATLEEKLAKLTPEQQKALTERIQSGQLSDRAKAGLDKFQNQTQQETSTPETAPTPEQINAQEKLSQILPNATPKVLEKDKVQATQEPKTETTTPAPQEPQTPEEPKATQEPQTPTPITNIQEFKNAGSNIDNLQKFVENRYGASSIDGDRVVAKIGDKEYEWTIDEGGNPIRKEIGSTQKETPQVQLPELDVKEQEAKDSGIPYKKTVSGGIVYKPENLDDLFELYATQGTGVKIAGETLTQIKGGILYNKLKNKVGVDKDTLISSLKAGEIQYGEDTWDYLTKLNGGTPTEEMIQAKKEYDKYLDDKKTVELQNRTFDLLEGNELPSATNFYTSIMEQMNTMLSKQEDQIKFMNSRYDVELENYKLKQTETNQKFDKLNKLKSELEELTDERDDVIRNVKKQYPNLDYSTQLLIAQNQTLAIDDAIKVKNREYTNAFRSYEQARQIDLETYQMKIQNIDREVKFMEQIFQNQAKQFEMASSFALSEFQYNRDLQRADFEYQRGIDKEKDDIKTALQKQEDLMELQYRYAIKTGDYEQANKIDLMREQFMLAGGKISTDENGNIIYSDGEITTSANPFYKAILGGGSKTGLEVSGDEKATQLLNAEPGTLIPTRQNKDQLTPGNPGGKECGEFVNDTVGERGVFWLGNTLEDKMSIMENTWEGSISTEDGIESDILKTKIGDVAVWNPGKNKWGHAGIVIDKKGRGENTMYLIKSSNIASDGRVSEDWVSISQLLGTATPPKKISYKGQEVDNVVEKARASNISDEGIKKILTNSPQDLIKSGELAYTGLGLEEISAIKNTMNFAISETASEFGIRSADAFIKGFGESLAKASDNDVNLMTGDLKLVMAEGDKEGVKQWIVESLNSKSDKNGLKKIRNGLGQIRKVADMTGLFYDAYNKLSDTEKKKINTNIAEMTGAQIARTLGLENELIEFNQQVDFMTKEYQLQMTGQASTDEEFKRIMGMMPNARNVNELNQNLIEGYYNYYTKSNLGDLEGQLNGFDLSLKELYPDIFDLKSYKTFKINNSTDNLEQY